MLKFDDSKITPPKKYNVVTKLNLEPNQVGVKHKGNMMKSNIVYV